MVSLVSCSVEPHLHLDPTLNVKPRCKSCMPGGKFFCCIFSCCNSKSSSLRNRAVYCDKFGCCKEFDYNDADDIDRRVAKTSRRVAHLVSKIKPLEEVFEQTGVDLNAKAIGGEAITVGEIKKVKKALV